MTVDGTLKLIDATTKLLAVLVWPIVVIIILRRLGPALHKFILNMGEFSLKAPGGFEATGKRQVEAAAALAMATVTHSDSETAPEAVAGVAAQKVIEVATPQVIRRASTATILWVDDRPDNNIHERQAFEALGIRFVLATSTEEALQKIAGQPFDAIISDMGRPPDQRAGYTLLDKLRASGNQTTFIIYAGSRAPEHVAEARRRGALGCTNLPNELFEIVLSALKDRRVAQS
jgi:CheY-like chemotaxis protein